MNCEEFDGCQLVQRHTTTQEFDKYSEHNSSKQTNENNHYNYTEGDYTIFKEILELLDSNYSEHSNHTCSSQHRSVQTETALEFGDLHTNRKTPHSEKGIQVSQTEMFGSRPTKFQKILIVVIIGLGGYIILSKPSSPNEDDDIFKESMLDPKEIEKEIENRDNVFKDVTYKSPFDPGQPFALPPVPKDPESNQVDGNEHNTGKSQALKYHKVWRWANGLIRRKEMFPNTKEVDVVLEALRTAKIVHVDVLDIGEYESGTSEKWLITLEGGQKAMMKLVWEEKGTMKKDALCNFGHEMPTAEIAAFHLHRVIGFRNTPYVVGRKVHLLDEILPAASPIVSKQIKVNSGSPSCITGKCFYCQHQDTMCPDDGFVEASVAYYIPRHLKLYTYPPKYMPWSTPNMKDGWGKYGFNNKTYCNALRKDHPYETDWYYLDLFDFAVIDTLLYHYDSKHYVVYDDSEAHGLTIRLDHGRAFCAHDRDELFVFLTPITQCCTLRRSTYNKLNALRDGALSRELRQYISQDVVQPILQEEWFPTLDRRLKIILDAIDKCSQANGGIEKVLVNG